MTSALPKSDALLLDLKLGTMDSKSERHKTNEVVHKKGIAVLVMVDSNMNLKAEHHSLRLAQFVRCIHGQDL